MAEKGQEKKVRLVNGTGHSIVSQALQLARIGSIGRVSFHVVHRVRRVRDHVVLER